MIKTTLISVAWVALCYTPTHAQPVVETVLSFAVHDASARPLRFVASTDGSHRSKTGGFSVEASFFAAEAPDVRGATARLSHDESERFSTVSYAAWPQDSLRIRVRHGDDTLLVELLHLPVNRLGEHFFLDLPPFQAGIRRVDLAEQRSVERPSGDGTTIVVPSWRAERAKRWREKGWQRFANASTEWRTGERPVIAAGAVFDVRGRNAEVLTSAVLTVNGHRMVYDTDRMGWVAPAALQAPFTATVEAPGFVRATVQHLSPLGTYRLSRAEDATFYDQAGYAAPCRNTPNTWLVAARTEDSAKREQIAVALEHLAMRSGAHLRALAWPEPGKGQERFPLDGLYVLERSPTSTTRPEELVSNLRAVAGVEFVGPAIFQHDGQVVPQTYLDKVTVTVVGDLDVATEIASRLQHQGWSPRVVSQRQAGTYRVVVSTTGATLQDYNRQLEAIQAETAPLLAEPMVWGIDP